MKDLKLFVAYALFASCIVGVCIWGITQDYKYGGNPELEEKEYPKTFLGCCDVLGIEDLISRGVNGYRSELLDAFQKLLVCRDAYWKIAGDEMGLGKPWKPDWSIYEHKFCLGTDKDKIIEECVTTGNRILAFPTEEMRDAFYENFKEEIESVKELL